MARIKVLEERSFNRDLAELELLKDDSNKCYTAIRKMNRKSTKKSNIYVHDKDGHFGGTDSAKTDIITEHFIRMLAPDNQEIKNYLPSKIQQPFTAAEFSQAASRLKNGKSAVCDDTQAEYIKYAPVEIYEQIATILNRVTETGEDLEELHLGILTPLQKPGKKKGPPENIRPIILLSVIRKILTKCMIKRIWNRLSKEIPTEQAAYQPGRGTTEHVWAVKMIAEKAIISSNYKAYLLLLDMSKAFDTVNRKILFDHLEEILALDELYIMSRLTNHPEIKVKVGKEFGRRFESTIGIMQGDCLSAALCKETVSQPYYSYTIWQNVSRKNKINCMVSTSVPSMQMTSLMLLPV